MRAACSILEPRLPLGFKPRLRRAVGDDDLKAVGVTAEAETLDLDLSPGDDFLILASDGLWDVVGPQQAVDLVNDTVKNAALCARVRGWRG